MMKGFVEKEADALALAEVRDAFVRQWGAMGSQWGINRSMAMIHALLLISPKPLATDDIMEALSISRGNANTNLRDLVDWGLVMPVLLKGDRRDFYTAEKDVWQIFCIVARERKRREMEPAQRVLENCVERIRDIPGDEARVLRDQLSALSDFVSTANGLMDRVSALPHGKVIPRVLKVLT